MFQETTDGSIGVTLASQNPNPHRGILPPFYSVARKDGIRYPGDEGPDPQVETDHESVEGEADDLTEAQISRPKRGRHVEHRRQNVKDSRARRLIRQALTEDRKMQRTDSKAFIDLEKLGAALGRKWPTYPGFQSVVDQLQKVRDGRDAGVSLLTLDTEFISTSRRILEVAVGELHSEELLKKPDGRPMSINAQRISFESLRKVYGSTGQERCSGKKTAREIAETLQRAGVTQTSIILVWHTSTFDLTILRELLESAGYRDILPSEENCIPVIKHYRAVPDIQMLRLMVLLLVQLQKSPSKRDLTEFPTTTQEFVGSGNPPYTFMERWLGLSQPNLGDEGDKGDEEEYDDDRYEDEDESNGDDDGQRQG
ncbi:hypothetical protein CEP53_009844 [Fusarium sp. AF-6]|nr:hypothetical protein CEP53_009844 [Fusarium sp. AF-6]